MSTTYLGRQAFAIRDMWTFGETSAQTFLGLTVCDGVRMPYAEGGELLARRRLHPVAGPVIPCGFRPAGVGAFLIPRINSALAHDADQSYH